MQLAHLLERERVTMPELDFQLEQALTLYEGGAVAVPRANSFEDIRLVADALRFVIVEAKGLIQTAFPNWGSRESEAYERFSSTMSNQRHRVVILTPVVNLDPLQVDQVDLYTGREAGPAVMAMAAIAPVLRNHGSRIAGLEQRLGSLERAREEARRWDPLAIGIPMGADIGTYAGAAAIGPCWGPDLPMIEGALKALNRGPDVQSASALRRYWKY